MAEEEEIPLPPPYQFYFVDYDQLRWRLVEPYYHKFETRFKERWKNRTIISIYEQEYNSPVANGLQSLPSSEQTYFQRAIRLGLIRVNNATVQPQYIVKKGDIITHLSHRHEPPVAFPDKRKLVIEETLDGVVVCDKPCTVPIHPTGAYRFNSLIWILERLDPTKYKDLKTIHRLDRLTSGLVLLATNALAAQRISNAIQNRVGSSAKKTYVARVYGKFPNNEKDVALLKMKGVTVKVRALDEEDELAVGAPWVIVSFPLAVLDAKRGVHICDEINGKESVSQFQFLYYNQMSNTSVIKCEPITGRTHQLRLHLQRIGHYIANDPNYGFKPTIASDDNKSTLGDDDGVDEAMDAPPEALTGDAKFTSLCKLELEKLPVVDLKRQLSLLHIGSMDHQEKEEETKINEAFRNHCVGCSRLMEPLKNRELWLHSIRFQVFENDSRVYDFRAPFPKWVDAHLITASTFWE